MCQSSSICNEIFKYCLFALCSSALWVSLNAKSPAILVESIAGLVGTVLECAKNVLERAKNVMECAESVSKSVGNVSESVGNLAERVEMIGRCLFHLVFLLISFGVSPP